VDVAATIASKPSASSSSTVEHRLAEVVGHHPGRRRRAADRPVEHQHGGPVDLCAKVARGLDEQLRRDRVHVVTVAAAARSDEPADRRPRQTSRRPPRRGRKPDAGLDVQVDVAAEHLERGRQVGGLDVVVARDREDLDVVLRGEPLQRPLERAQLGGRRPAAVERVAGEEHRVDVVLDGELERARPHLLLVAQPVAGLAAVVGAGAEVQIADAEEAGHAALRSASTPTSTHAWRLIAPESASPFVRHERPI
jgi:hypothetical protein